MTQPWCVHPNPRSIVVKLAGTKPNKILTKVVATVAGNTVRWFGWQCWAGGARAHTCTTEKTIISGKEWHVGTDRRPG